ncbi:unnamed protein product, partial [Lampetra planeri]
MDPGKSGEFRLSMRDNSGAVRSVDGDTAFLYLLSARHTRLTPQVLQQDQESVLLLGSPSQSLHNPPLPSTSTNGTSSQELETLHHLASSAQYQQQLRTNRPANYIVPGGYRPDTTELKRIQQEKEAIRQYQQAKEEERQENFAQLVLMDGHDLVPNPEPLECRICYVELQPGEGALLRECLHCFCRECLRSVIMLSEEPELVPAEEYERWLQRSLSSGGVSMPRGSYHCATADCPGWCVYEDTVNVFPLSRLQETQLPHLQ